ncbi:hypothetical protein VNO77_21770 [Canavalia gladiata]|uniref:Uncharacterized protein n=1 Tax=Canavalia gladiata TaxID=3824 RepID=A0AAN9L6J7_CANGL
MAISELVSDFKRHQLEMLFQYGILWLIKALLRKAHLRACDRKMILGVDMGDILIRSKFVGYRVLFGQCKFGASLLACPIIAITMINYAIGASGSAPFPITKGRF